jgi:4-hydroxybenzoate polyprenyltransferase
MTLSKYLSKTDLSGWLRLTRWPEHIPFTIPATLAGINMARGMADWRIPLVLVANILAVTFAFMVNDIEDAPDDARESHRAARNAITCGEITLRRAWWASAGIAALAWVLFAMLSRAAFAAGTLTILLGWLYSWRTVRLKAWPIFDVVSHALMLSALLFLAGYLAYDSAPGRAWFVALGVGLISAYGQLYNQLRDNTMDRAAGLHNTASVLGPRYTLIAMYACLIGAAISLGLTVIMGLWPLWLALIPVGIVPFALRRHSGADMRGTAALDLTGQWQGRAMLIANVMMLIWLVVNLVEVG